MTSVKWLERITVARPSRSTATSRRTRYRFRAQRGRRGRADHAHAAAGADGAARRAGVHDAAAHVEPGRCVVEGRAWSGGAPVAAVDVSADGGAHVDGSRARARARPLGVARLDIALGRRARATTSSLAAPATRPETSSRSSRNGTSAATRTTPSSASRSRSAESVDRRHATCRRVDTSSVALLNDTRTTRRYARRVNGRTEHAGRHEGCRGRRVRGHTARTGG